MRVGQIVFAPGYGTQKKTYEPDPKPVKKPKKGKT